MSEQQTSVAIIGCGNIADRYAELLLSYPELDVVGFADLDPARAVEFAERFGGRAYADVDALLADDGIQIVANLTIHHAHYDITTRCLESGKHVFSEKPMALKASEAWDMVALAEKKGLRLGCAPIIYMGEAQQTAWKMLREGKAGTIRVAYAEVNHGRIESWHPNPSPFYAVGPWFDVGVYPLTTLTTFFGPARKVTAAGKVLYPDRKTKEGVDFHIDTPDWIAAVIEFADGPLARLTTNFYVRSTTQKGIELHGDIGSIHLATFQSFNSPVSYADFGEEFESVPLLKEPYEGTEWGVGLRDMAAAIRENRPHRADGAHAAHVVEILNAAMKSIESGQPVELSSDFPRPAPMEWGQ